MNKEIIFGIGVVVVILVVIFTIRKPVDNTAEAITQLDGKVFFNDKEVKEVVEITVYSPDKKPLPNIKVGYIDGNGFEFFQVEDPQNKYLPFFDIFPHNSSHSFTMSLPDQGPIIEEIEPGSQKDQAYTLFDTWFNKNPKVVDLGVKTLEEWDEIADEKIALVSVFLPITGGKLKIIGTIRDILRQLTPNAPYSDPDQKYHIYSLLAFDGITSELYWLEEVEEKMANKPETEPLYVTEDTGYKYLGTWKRIGGGIEKELNYSSSWLKIVSINKQYIAYYVTSLDAYRNHEIEINLKDSRMIGDFYLEESVIIELFEPDKLYLTIDPLGEFVPIRKEIYQRTYDVEIYTQGWYAGVIENGKIINEKSREDVKNNKWQKYYSGDYFCSFPSIKCLGDNGYIIAATRKINSNNILFLLVLDKEGFIKSYKEYQNYTLDPVVELIPTKGGYFIAGTELMDVNTKERGFVLKIDTTGRVEWKTNSRSTCNNCFYDLIQTTDGFLLATGYSIKDPETNNLYVVKLDLFGRIIWENSYSSKSDIVSFVIHETNDGNYMVAGKEKNVKSNKIIGSHYVAKISKIGKRLWEKDFIFGEGVENSTYSIATAQNDKYILTGATTWNYNIYGGIFSCTYCIDENGNLIWNNIFPKKNNKPGNETNFTNLIINTADGNFLVAGHTDCRAEDADVDVFFLKYNGLGKLVKFDNSIGRGGSESVSSIDKTSDGGYIMAGTRSYATWKNDLFVIKLDSDEDFKPSYHFQEIKLSNYFKHEGTAISSSDKALFFIMNQAIALGVGKIISFTVENLAKQLIEEGSEEALKHAGAKLIGKVAGGVGGFVIGYLLDIPSVGSDAEAKLNINPSPDYQGRILLKNNESIEFDIDLNTGDRAGNLLVQLVKQNFDSRNEVINSLEFEIPDEGFQNYLFNDISIKFNEKGTYILQVVFPHGELYYGELRDLIYIEII